MNKKNEEIQKMFIDAIVEAPIEFTLGNKRFCIYPKTFAATVMIGNLRDLLKIDQENVRINPILECLRLCEDKREVVLRILSVCTLKGKEIQNSTLIEERMKFYDTNMEKSDMANLLLHCLQDDSEKLQTFKQALGIDEELKKKGLVLAAKKDSGSSISFGGKTIIGSLFGWFSEKYGWSIEYITYGISYVNLMMMYYDHFDSVYLTEDEKKRVPAACFLDHKNVFDGNNKEDLMELIRQSEENPI